MSLSDEHRSLISKLQPVDLPEIPCLECEPDIDGLHITHAALCPVAMCIDDIVAADKVWFQEHPFADFYNRPVTWGEGAVLVVQDPKMVEASESFQLAVQGRVRVERMNDGARIRRFDDVWFLIVPRPDAEPELLHTPPTQPNIPE